MAFDCFNKILVLLLRPVLLKRLFQDFEQVCVWMFVIGPDRFAHSLRMAKHLVPRFRLDCLYDLGDVFTMLSDGIGESCMLFRCPLFEGPFLFETFYVQNCSFPVEFPLALLLQFALQLIAEP